LSTNRLSKHGALRLLTAAARRPQDSTVMLTPTQPRRPAAAKHGRRPRRPISPAESAADRPPCAHAEGDPEEAPKIRLADHLQQHGRTARRYLCPPASFRAAADDCLTDPVESAARDELSTGCGTAPASGSTEMSLNHSRAAEPSESISLTAPRGSYGYRSA